MIDTSKQGWTLKKKDFGAGVEWPYIQIDDPSMAVIRIEWNGKTIWINCDNNHLYEKYADEPCIGMAMATKLDENGKHETMKSAWFVGDGLVAYDSSIENPEPGTSRCTSIEEWESKELRGCKKGI